MKLLTAILIFLFSLTPLWAQNPDFDLKYKQAQSLYEKGQFEQARTNILNALKKYDSSLTWSQKTSGNRLASQCEKAIANRDRLNLASTELILGYQSGLDSIGFDAGKPQLVTATSDSPSWCKVERLGNGYIFLKSELNPDKNERHATVTVKMGRIKTVLVKVIQQPRPDTQKQVVISTSPDRARISVDGSDSSVGVWEGTLSSGQHKLHVEKNGFAVKDTVITVLDDMRNEQMMDIHLDLAPQFGKLTVNILPETGFSFGPDLPILSLNGVITNFNPQELFSYDDDRDIQRYTIYDDGTIPVSAGRLDVTVSAKGYEAQFFSMYIKPGETVNLSRTLSAITGNVTIEDAGNAFDATVFLDGQDMGLVRDYVRHRTIIGDHVITLKKDGFVSEENSYPISVKEGASTTIPVRMVRYTPYVFTSNPDNARVSVDGEYIGLTPTEPYILLEKAPGHSYTVEITKDSYFPIVRTITPDFSSSETVNEHNELKRTSFFKIEADRENILATIRNRSKVDTTFFEDLQLPAEVNLPIRENPYLVTMRRVGDKKNVYKRSFKFNDPDKNTLDVQTYSRYNFQAISANYYLTGATASIGSKSYQNMGNVSLMKFRLFPGLSTSVAHAGFFMGKEPDAPIIESDPETGVDYEISSKQFNYLPAISILFINGEFRAGGYITDYMQVNSLVSYAWYPDIIKKIAGFSHVTGHDLFIGAEISSNIKYFNANVKAGLQTYPGGLTANIYDEGKKGPGMSSTNVEDKYVCLPVAGIPPTQFVISVGFSFGGRNSKGQNTLRLFHF